MLHGIKHLIGWVLWGFFGWGFLFWSFFGWGGLRFFGFCFFLKRLILHTELLNCWDLQWKWRMSCFSLYWQCPGFDLYYKGITEHEEAWWLWKPAPERLWTYFAPHPTHFQSIQLPHKQFTLGLFGCTWSILARRAGSGKHNPCSCRREHTLSPGRHCAYRLPVWKTVKSALEGGVGNSQYCL